MQARIRKKTRTKRPLVIEHLENISRDALEGYQSLLREHVKGRQGIYALYRRERLYYVGLASNLRNRLKSHLRDRHAGGWDRFSLYLTRTTDYLRELEALALRISTPKGNVAKTRFSHAKDLRRIFRAQVKKRQRAELAALFGYVTGPRRSDRQTRLGRKKDRRVRLSDVIQGRLPVRLRYKGRVYRGVVRKSGMIYFKGRAYDSPSAAAKAAMGRTRNGWSWWKYEASPDTWVSLGKLRHS